MTGWIYAKVNQRREWAPGLMTLGLDVKPEFKPGQFMNLALRFEGELVRRSYSLSSAPGQEAEFYVNGVDSGLLSPKLLALREGDSIELETKAYGFFTLDYVPEARDAWLLSTGTGLGPFISMLRSGELLRRFEHVVVVHGVRVAAHFGYREELDDLAKEHPDRVRLVRLISREAPSSGELVGRIPQYLADGGIEKLARLHLNAATSHVLICGNPEMIREASHVLEERGLKKHRQRAPGQITTENYW
jgi:ferredoxin--NADP+ reductase